MTRRSVAIIIHDGVQSLDVAGSLDVLTSANELLNAEDGYDITIVASCAGAVRASNGMSIFADAGYSEAATVFDTVLIAGGPTLVERPLEDMRSWFLEWGSRAERHGAVSTGAFALGRAGLLDGKVATTDEREIPTLATMFPAARVVNDGAIVRDGRLVTSAGASAAVELGLALVSWDHGTGVATAIARHLGDRGLARTGMQTPLSGPPPAPLTRVLDHIRAHLAEPLSVERLSSVAAMSSRSLARLFAVELNTTPHDFVEARRTELAQALLQNSDSGLKVLAHRCGFGGAEQMRVVFQRRLGMSPTFYRNRARCGVPAEAVHPEQGEHRTPHSPTPSVSASRTEPRQAFAGHARRASWHTSRRFGVA